MRSMAILKICLLKHLKSIKFWIPFVLVFSAVYNAALPISKMTSEFKTPINGFSVSFLLSNKYVTFILFLGLFILLSDMPTRDEQQKYLLVRSGRIPWVLGQLVYVFIVTLIYLLFFFTSYFIVLSPYIAFDPFNWGKVVRSISGTNAYDVFGMNIQMPPKVLSDYRPLDAFECSAGMALFIALTIGGVFFTLNLISKNFTGHITVGIVIIMYLFVNDTNAINVKMYYLSPIGWCSLSLMDKSRSSVMPDYPYAISFLALVMLVTLVIIFFYCNKKVNLDGEVQI